MAVLAALYQELQGDSPSNGAMAYNWFEQMAEEMRKKLEGARSYMNQISIAGYVSVAIGRIKTAAKTVANKVTGAAEYPVESLPDYLKALYDGLGKEKPGIYYHNMLGAAFQKAGRVLGFYNGQDIYVRTGMSKAEELQTLAHELTHAYQKEAGLLENTRNSQSYRRSTYRRFIEGMANYFAKMYMKLNGKDQGTLNASYPQETEAFKQVFEYYRAQANKNYALGIPEGIREAMNDISKNLPIFYQNFVSAYNSVSSSTGILSHVRSYIGGISGAYRSGSPAPSCGAPAYEPAKA